MGREGAKAKAGTSKSRLPGLNWEELRNVTFWVDLIAENATSFFTRGPEQLTGRVRVQSPAASTQLHS